MRRAPLFVVVVALLATACSGEPEGTEVLGVVLERTPSPAADVSPTPEPSPVALARYPEPATEIHPEAEPSPPPSTSAQPVTSSQPEPQPEPEPDPSPTVSTWTVPDGHSGESGTVWMVHDEDGTRRWTETSSTSLDRSGAGAPARNPLRVSLPSGGALDAAERDAVCAGGLHADEDIEIVAHGTIVLTLLVDGQPVATSRTRVDVVIAPGSGIAAAELAGPVTVTLADTSRVECVVTFAR